MTRRSLVTWVCGLALPLAPLATACSSTSSQAASGTDAGADSSVVPALEGGADANSGAPTGVSLQWSTYLYPTNSVGDGGSAYTEGGVPTEAGSAGDEAGASTGDAGANAGVPDVQVCAYLQSGVSSGAVPAPSSALSCVMTGADGGFVFPSLPVRTNLVLTLNKAGLVPVVLTISTASAPVDGRGSPVYLYTAPSSTSGNTSPVPGVTADPQKGEIFLFAIGPDPDGGSNFGGEPGATVSIHPMSGSGPFYQTADGQYDTSATAFIQNGAAFVNVDPGTYTLTFADANDNCQPLLMPAGLWGIPLVTPAHSLQVVVFPGYAAGLVGVFCTKNPVIVPVDGG